MTDAITSNDNGTGTGTGTGNGHAGRLCVLVADPDGLARTMLSVSLYDVKRIAMVLCAADCHEALELARRYRPEIAIIDTGLPTRECLAELVAGLLSASPRTRVVTVSADDDGAALAALRAGAVGHLGKDIDPEVLARQVTRAADGEAIVPRHLTMDLLELVREVPESGWRPVRSRLTTREWEVVDLLGEGASTRDIAERLVLSTTTVYSHVKSVLRKLDVHSRREAISAAQALRREEALGTNLPNGAA